jgi:predicted amidophosphoribosyltransferase
MNPSDPDRRAYCRDVMRRWRALRRKRNVCLQCAEPLPDQRHVRCAECRKIVAIKQQERRIRQMLGNIT